MTKKRDAHRISRDISSKKTFFQTLKGKDFISVRVVCYLYFMHVYKLKENEYESL